MSRIGKKPIDIPSNIKVEVKGQHIKMTGPAGSLEMDCAPMVQIKSEGGKLVVENPQPENRQAKEIHGTTRALLSNMVRGVTSGFEKKLEIYGTGYNVKEQSGKIVLQVGYCQTREIKIPKGVKLIIEVPATRGDEVPAKFAVVGSDKCVLNHFASEIRKVRPPEPYKGKGIRFADEHVKRKVGKAFASAATG